MSFESDSEEDGNILLGLGNTPYQFKPYLEGVEGAPEVVEEEEEKVRSIFISRFSTSTRVKLAEVMCSYSHIYFSLNYVTFVYYKYIATGLKWFEPFKLVNIEKQTWSFSGDRTCNYANVHCGRYAASL